MAWLPFLASYVPPTSAGALGLPLPIANLPVIPSLIAAVGLHRGERTSVIEYLTIFGVPYLFGVALVLFGALRNWSAIAASERTRSPHRLRRDLVPGVLLSAPVIPLCGIPLALASRNCGPRARTRPRSFALLLFSLGWALSIGVELVYIRDVFNDRMNTLFKFYYQTWTLFALATAVTIALLWSAALQLAASDAVGWPRSLLLLAGAVYPIVASYQWTDQFAAWQGLDGLAYGEETDPGRHRRHPLAGSTRRARRRRSGSGGMLLSAVRPLPFNRVSAFTGVPTSSAGGTIISGNGVLGQPALLARSIPAEATWPQMFADPDSPLFATYGVTWLFVGEYESGDWRDRMQDGRPL